MFKFISKIFDSNQKTLTSITPLVEKINSLEAEIKKLKLSEFSEKTAEFKERLSHGETLDDILPEAYALVREAAFRTIGERHYDVQLIAGIVLHRGGVAEQKTGEGKTLSSIPALYLNSLTGKGVHLVTVNDYLARRDAGWMGPIFHLLGLSTAAMIHDQSFLFDPDFEDKSATDSRLRHLKPITRKEAYLADITYGINSEFGFDYLRDNMISDISQVSQRGYHYAVVDEVDSVLIDEARTPHIISAPDTEPTKKYYDYARMTERVTQDPKNYVVDEKMHTAHLTEEGIMKVEQMLGVENLYEKDFETVHHIEAALKARTLFHNDKEYVVKDGQVIIVDEFTGRMLHGRRFSEGLHQAIEAKEGVPIQQESRTLATVSLQNYFRMYEKLAGMTGTAATEAEEFHKIYNLDVVVIPTHKPMVRIDHPDSVYKTGKAKFDAVVKDIAEAYKKGQPVLVGTTSIEKNEYLSELLRRKGVPHQMLNAKNHEKEATIISEAGKKGAVTVATNMAGRGVDIILGGTKKEKGDLSDKEYKKILADWDKEHEEVMRLGGLHVIGTERHESRRIDNQLRGRSGRQGDPGSSRFYVGLDDDIMRLFGGDQVAKLMTIFKLPEDVPLEHSMVSRAIEQAQVKVEGFHFDTRKHLVEYDDVLNKQREIVYKLRRQILEGKDLKNMILDKLISRVTILVQMHSSEGFSQQELEKIHTDFISMIPFDPNSQKDLLTKLGEHKSADEMISFLTKITEDIYTQKEKQMTPEVMRQVERWVCLSVVDNFWMNHLDAIDDLREGIGLRGYGQKDPLVEYKNEAYTMFESLVTAIDYEITQRIFRVQVQLAPDQVQALQHQHQTTIQKSAQQQITNQKTNISSPTNSKKKLGRNDPCWCGSGKKWKKCHYPQLPQ
ncbi:preprotein translocase subunit SecA [Candidatus Gottesmanbacteria bacterium RIFCSPHIGHO2_01_FULL_39_10]|uniref:Protein translocase subunit SecA n=1 Tax=Candidatus Gottesmanbacteria bacterium RIFCSPHIGHO2_01_FULL_39_10 TaxID=1798375 RepID=A0A1F5ZSV1_9BACT|nr:MAG: preprotein translocase subunit SecA [Candidatus Gottesmanbacteria bacterium RIFCSPHIGHO2_01_FULL_39_10]